MSLFPRSIHRWLPLSYALNVTLGVVTLAMLLIFTLQAFYAAQERRYLEQNGEVLSGLLEPVLIENNDLNLLEPQLNTLSFLTQTRIQLFSSSGEMLIDTGSPNNQSGVLTTRFEAEQGNVTQQIMQTVDTALAAETLTTQIVIEDGNRMIQSEMTQSGGLSTGSNFALVSPFDILQSPLNSTFGLGNRRSGQRLERPINTVFGEQVGTLVLSEGPAYGSSIVLTVTFLSLLAGGLAVGLAILFGRWQSRVLIQPLTRLTETTQRMAAGDLSVRAEVGRLDETGEVAHQFNQMATQIESQVGQLKRFVADAAHQINTPLTALRTQLELAHSLDEADKPSPHVMRNISQAITQTGRLEQLTADLLQLSRLEVEQSIEMVSLDLNQLIFDWSETAAARAEQAGIQLVLDLPAESVSVSGHPASLMLMLGNLFENAMKFTLASFEELDGKREDGKIIEVVLKLKEGWVNLIFQDSGIGFDGDPGRVFERFYRGQNASSIAGSGLGLAIVKEVVILHQGEVWLESNPRGCCVTISLPQITNKKL